MKVCTKDSILDQLKQARNELGEILEVEEYLNPEHVDNIKRTRTAIKNAIDFVRVV